MNSNIYIRQWDVASFTKSSQKPYKISERYDGRWECSCPAWTRHTPRTDCKHIIKVRKANHFSPDNPVFDVSASPIAPAATSPRFVIDGYTIRRRALDDIASTYTETPTATGRSRRDI